jgi:hypothetical protein
MNSPQTPNPISPYFTPKKNPRVYTPIESVYAWLCFLAGYLFCRVFPVTLSPFGGLLFVVALFTGTAIIFKIKKVKFRILPTVIAFSAILISLALILCSNELMRFLAYAYSLLSYIYFIYAIHGNTVKRGFSGLIVLDYLNALLSAFDSLIHLFRAMFYGKAQKSGKMILRVLIGIAIAVIPTALVLSLLSYDSSFSSLLKKIFDFDAWDIFSRILSLIFAIPIGMYIFGTYVSSSDKTFSNMISAESSEITLQKMKLLSSLTVLVASLPILFIYVVFFISQWQYYISGFTGVLPEGFSYAEYAREGFFQLLAVSIINLAIIIAIHIFTKRNTTLPKITLKILTVVYSLFTLVLISTALAKMVMYIEWYGLTRKRVYATCVMIVLAVFFVMMILRQFIKKIPVTAVSLVLSFVMFIGLTLFNVDAMIARYNVDHYIDGTLETVDVDALYRLGYAGIPELVRLLDVVSADENKETYEEIMDVLKNMAEYLNEEERDIFSFNIPVFKAEKALRELGLLEK